MTNSTPLYVYVFTVTVLHYFGVPRAQPREAPKVGSRGRVDLGYAAKNRYPMALNPDWLIRDTFLE